VYLDPARIPLGPIERVDVVVLPASLQVYLVTRRHRSTSPQTQVGILSGLQDIADYRAGYAIRTRGGLGVSLLADWNSVGQGPFNSTSTPFGSSDLWLKLDYVPPDGRIGASFQISSASWHRSAAGPVAGWRQDRRDRLLRLFVAQRDDGTGWRFTTTLATSGISQDTAIAPRTLSMAIVEASEVLPRAELGAAARFGAGGFPQQLEARGGWTPIAPLTVAAWVRQSLYSAGRSGTRGYLTGGLALPLGFSARAEIAWQRDLQAPLVASDRAQQALDVAGWVGFHSRRLTFEIGRGRRDPFAPLGFAQGIGTVDSLGPTPATAFLAGHAAVQIVSGLTLAGWYFGPVTGGGDFEPPHHGRLSLTFYSKFWRVFKSGIFALRGEVAMESWGSWPFGGIDTTGAGQRQLPGATFVDTHLEMQLAGVTLFWTIQNVNLMRGSYVNGLGFPRAAQQYGARWFFTN
jgi:hypothetical protein